MSQITDFYGVKFFAWKPGSVKFWTNIMSASEKAVFCYININDFNRTFLALFISIFIWICLLAKDRTCQLWIIQLNFSPLFNLKQSRSLLCLLQFISLQKLTYVLTCVSEDVRFNFIIICHLIPLEADHAFSRWEDRGRKVQGGGEDEEGRVPTFW